MSRTVRKSLRTVFWLIGFVFLFTTILYLTYREPFEEVPLSTAVFDRDGGLLGARVASDGQWRFAAPDSVPQKYIDCLLEFEDHYFFKHPGVNPFALIRALRQNIQAHEIVSGGSTLTMQVIRLSRDHPPRTVWQKFIEMLLAVRLELRESKSDILSLYASYAPMGGNVVGLDAAAWRYFGHASRDLSWAEAATLAVLPNAPSLIHPARNREALREKRNDLLSDLLEKGKIDSTTFSLARVEELPDQPRKLPERAYHLVQYYQKNGEHRVQSSIDPDLQDRSRDILIRHQKKLKANQIHNLAILVLNNKTGEVLVYHGNGQYDGESIHGHQVDVIRSERSSGSVLKPFLYAGMLDAGEILPGTLVADIPTHYADFSPNNFNKEFDGAVPADQALIRSLNVPAVRMLRKFGILRFYHLLEDLGMNTLHREADDYGLSLILGGAEISLWNICHSYSEFAHSLEDEKEYPLSDPAVYLTLQAMKEVSRPVTEAGWSQFLSATQLAWKTGTSYGFRDAWAIGVNPDFTIGVWAGNADGEGRPGLTGVGVAAPILFEVAALLPRVDGWFQLPLNQMQQVVVCHTSGMLASSNCPETDTINIPALGVQTPQCPYHLRIALDQQSMHRVHGDCYPVNKMVFANWFVLPPAMAWYYASRHPLYAPLPAWLPGCIPLNDHPLDIIYPHPNEEIFIPKNEAGMSEQLLIQATHQSPDARLFWFLDNEFIGATSQVHHMGIQPGEGAHEIHITDQDGNEVSRRFRITSPLSK